MSQTVFTTRQTRLTTRLTRLFVLLTLLTGTYVFYALGTLRVPTGIPEAKRVKREYGCPVPETMLVYLLF